MNNNLGMASRFIAKRLPIGLHVLPSLHVRLYYFLYIFLFFRRLSEKTAEPIIAKPEHMMYACSALRKLRQAFSVSYQSCPVLKFTTKNNTF